MDPKENRVVATLWISGYMIRQAIEEYARNHLLPPGFGIHKVECNESYESCIRMALLPAPEVAEKAEEKTSDLWFRLDNIRRRGIEILKGIPWPNQMNEHPADVESAVQKWGDFNDGFLRTLAALAKAGRLASSNSIPQELIDWMHQPINPPDMPRLIYYENHRGEKAWRGVVITRVWHGSSKFYPEVGWYFDAFDIEKWAMRTFKEQRVLDSGLAFYPFADAKEFGFLDRYYAMKQREERRIAAAKSDA